VEAVRNNILGTRIVGEAALTYGTERFVLISTDKAINPTNVMGATKWVAECLIHEFNQKTRCRFSAVRFGNVLGSNGSVVPLFAKQIEKGGPVTVTHPEIKRFFMTIPESVQLTLQASSMGQGGEIFVLEMGEQIYVADLARNMIRLSGLVPNRDVSIAFIGLRPGEKLSEELFSKDERVEPTRHAKIKRVVPSSFNDGDLAKHLVELEKEVRFGSSKEIIKTLKGIVPGYSPGLQ